MKYPSWGFYPKVNHERAVRLERDAVGPLNFEPYLLPRGLGRSYGDSCLNDGNTLLLNESFNRFISFDEKTGLLHCESGVSLDEILKVFVPKGWFLKVTPGTKHVTVGGAIANDVHGKNHHRVGSFGNWVESIRLLKSNGEIVELSANSNPELFYATIGGLGLTGFIISASFYLKKIESSYINQEQITFSNLREFFQINSESESYDYTVAWVDCVNGENLRGIYIRGTESQDGRLDTHNDPKLRVPFFLPNWILNSFSMRIFNHLYYIKNWKKKLSSTVHYDKFFYPLDSISNWNRIYGKRGFFQYQFVVPTTDEGIHTLEQIFHLIKKNKQGSFLAVLKTFGDISPVGLLSFPYKGITLALDFPNVAPVRELFSKCDILIEKVGGRIYPAKDAHMGAELFNSAYQQKDTFKKYQDPKFSSNFSRRVKL